MQTRQRGFTLVEIAVVLVIIGLLLGGVLKGQELIASARVRNLADQQSGIQAAFFGFQDRYRAVPGDMDSGDAQNAIGQPVSLGGNGDGQLQAPSSSGNPPWAELNGVWEHLSKAGFMKGSYEGPTDSPPQDQSDGPINAFNGQVIMGRHNGYQDTGTPAPRLVLHLGQQVPVDIARELDTKIDDANPRAGTLRNAATGTEPYQSDGTACVTTTSGGEPIWDIAGDAQDCNPTILY